MNFAELVFGETASGSIERQDLTAALNTTDVALNHYTIPAGEGLPGGLHTHMDQEEVFVVLDGVATFETFDGTETVGTDEAIRFGPGEFQTGRNAGDSALRILAVGAPKETEDVRIPAVCPACGHESLRLDFGDANLTFRCPSCDAEHIPADCPTCGHSELEIGLREDNETVVICQQCGTQFDDPPLK